MRAQLGLTQVVSTQSADFDCLCGTKCVSWIRYVCSHSFHNYNFSLQMPNVRSVCDEPQLDVIRACEIPILIVAEM